MISQRYIKSCSCPADVPTILGGSLRVSAMQSLAGRPMVEVAMGEPVCPMCAKQWHPEGGVRLEDSYS